MDLPPSDGPRPPLPLQGALVGALPLPLRRAPPCVQRAVVWRAQAHAILCWLLPSWRICTAWFLVLCFPRVVALTFSLILKVLARAVVIFVAECLHQASLGAFQSLEGLIGSLWSLEYLALSSVDQVLLASTTSVGLANWGDLFGAPAGGSGAGAIAPAPEAEGLHGGLPVGLRATPPVYPHPLLPFAAGSQIAVALWWLIKCIRRRAAGPAATE